MTVSTFLGRKHTLSARAKMSEAWSPERRIKQAEIARQRNRDPQFREENGPRLRGKKHPPRSLEARARVGNFWRGRKRSQKQINKWRAWWETLSEPRKVQRLRVMNVARSRLSKTTTSLEKPVAQFLCSLKVIFLRQIPVGRYLVDFYLPRYGLVVECDGEYWHRPEHDSKRDIYMAKLGLSVARLKERSIRSGEYEQWFHHLLG